MKHTHLRNFFARFSEHFGNKIPGSGIVCNKCFQVWWYTSRSADYKYLASFLIYAWPLTHEQNNPFTFDSMSFRRV